jgi:anti-anti-sigma factor
VRRQSRQRRPRRVSTGFLWNRDGPGMSLNDIVANPSLGGLRFSTHVEDGYTVATLSGELDVGCTPELREQLLAVLTPWASRLVLDLSGISFCDASGLAVLVSTSRRAALLGGLLRVVAPSSHVDVALRETGLLRLFEIFPTVAAATEALRVTRRVPGASAHAAHRGTTGPIWPAWQPRFTKTSDIPGERDLREAVGALLAHADSWRDADPDRMFTVPLEALARAQASHDHIGLATAARSLLSALTRYPIAYSPQVAATAFDLRRLVGTPSRPPVQT